MNIEKFINDAKKEARKGCITEWHMGAVIVKGGKVVGRGYNRFSGKIVHFETKYNVKLFSLHAEMASILDCNENLTNAVMFVAGIKNGNRVYCRPCKHCMKIIKHIGFKAVYYETKEGIEAIFFDR